MTDLPPIPEPLEPSVFEGIRQLQAFCGQNAAAKGFDKNPDRVKALAAAFAAEGDTEFANYLISLLHSQSMMLVVDEVSEKHNEIRDGHAYDEQYEVNGKPEGAPSESADIIIREMHKNAQEGVDIAAVIQRKLGFNSTRPMLNGKKY